MTKAERPTTPAEVLIDDRAFHSEMVEPVHLMNAAHHMHREKADKDRSLEGDTYNQEDHHYLFTMTELILADAKLRFSEETGGVKRVMGHKAAYLAANVLIEAGILIPFSKITEKGQMQMYYEYVQSPLTLASPEE